MVATGSAICEARPHRPLEGGLIVWLTGLSGAGKSTIAEYVYRNLLAAGYRTEVLDGDTIRRELSLGLGFSRDDRNENIRRIAFVSQLLAKHGVIVLVAAISPYREAREQVRRSMGEFLEVYVNAPLSLCETRDPKGLYGKARRGELSSFTGIDDPYEAPLWPDVECRTDRENVEASGNRVLAAIFQRTGPAEP